MHHRWPHLPSLAATKKTMTDFDPLPIPTSIAPDAQATITLALNEIRTALTTLDLHDHLPRHRRYWSQWHIARAELVLAQYLDYEE